MLAVEPSGFLVCLFAFLFFLLFDGTRDRTQDLTHAREALQHRFIPQPNALDTLVYNMGLFICWWWLQIGVPKSCSQVSEMEKWAQDSEVSR